MCEDCRWTGDIQDFDPRVQRKNDVGSFGHKIIIAEIIINDYCLILTQDKKGFDMKIHYLIYDDMTALDLIGPAQVWNFFPDIEAKFVAKSHDPITTDSGMVFSPTHTFDEVTSSPDILFVPGGTGGAGAAAVDETTLEFLHEQGQKASWVTSVCTGAMILGAAGLLDGYKAATHWGAMQFLPQFGAIPTDARYVIDRNRATGGGVTSGIDFGLATMAEISSESLARMAQLALEYTPAPPFVSGHPREAKSETLALLEKEAGDFDFKKLFGHLKKK